MNTSTQRMPRSEVVQLFLDQFESPSYLEIGVARGETFHAVAAARKVAVDPLFQFDVLKHETRTIRFHSVPSDTYFGEIAQPEDRFDVIYIDGLHTAEQTLRDLINAQHFLKAEGVIIIDDVWPSSFVAAIRDLDQHKLVRECLNEQSPAWMGDVFKLLYFIDTFMQQFTLRIINDNFGQAVMWRQRRQTVCDRTLLDVSMKTFTNLICDGEFQKIPVATVVHQFEVWREKATLTASAATISDKVVARSQFVPLSTRLFPKNLGADKYRLTGLAAKCDWCVCSDVQAPTVTLHKKIGTTDPRYIFLSLRNPFEAINHFAENILPEITAPFVLISGSEDVTIPNQNDKRWRQFDEREKNNLMKIQNHSKLVHWFAENLDQSMGDKVTPIPLGMVSLTNPDAPLVVPDWPDHRSRPLTVLCAHRVREGAQWEQRRQVTQLAKTHWQDWCTVQEDELSEITYFELAQQHGFVVCVKGGGIDPSPKAWQSILHGVIPIFKSSAIDDAYKELPCVMIEAWTPDCITPEKLEKWSRDLAPKFEGTSAKERIVEALSLEHWWDKISKYIP